MDSAVDDPPGEDINPVETDKRGELGLDIIVPFFPMSNNFRPLLKPLNITRIFHSFSHVKCLKQSRTNENN